jgi:hypothetical protein
VSELYIGDLLVCDKCQTVEYNLNLEGQVCGRKLNHNTSLERHCDGTLLRQSARRTE